jgi:uncharacterized protein YkwD
MKLPGVKRVRSFLARIVVPLGCSALGLALLTGGSPNFIQTAEAAALSRNLYTDQSQDLQSLRQFALALTNRDRARYGRVALRLDARLNEAAQRHAEDMLRRNYFNHYSPEGRSPSDRFAAVGGRGGAGENIAVIKAPTLGRVDAKRLDFFERQWMKSPGHRKNLLDARYTRFGFGIAAVGDRIYAVQLFSFGR